MIRNNKFISMITTMLKIGFIGFGGGTALIPVIEEEIVEKNKVVTEEQYNNEVMIASITPGALPVEIASGIGYVAEIDGRIAGSMALLTHDPAYDAIDGAWIAAGPYIAVHRLAFSDEYRGKGLFGSLISSLRALAAEQDAASIRIDTDRHNPIMIHLLEKNGFISTGFVLFAGDRKLAYELPL